MTTVAERPEAPVAGAGFRTAAAMVREHAEIRPDKVAFREKDFGIWQETTWSEFWELVLDAAHGLLALGSRRG